MAVQEEAFYRITAVLFDTRVFPPFFYVHYSSCEENYLNGVPREFYEECMKSNGIRWSDTVDKNFYISRSRPLLAQFTSRIQNWSQLEEIMEWNHFQRKTVFLAACHRPILLARNVVLCEDVVTTGVPLPDILRWREYVVVFLPEFLATHVDKLSRKCCECPIVFCDEHKKKKCC